jgi:hypothetical protein
MDSRIVAYAKRLGRPLATDLILGATLVRCAWPQCKESTYWRRPRQHKHGTCIDHAVSDPQSVSTAQAFTALALAFPGAEVTRYRPQRWHRGAYQGERVRVWVRTVFVLSGLRSVRSMVVAPLDAGPCERCRQPVRRYGDSAYPLCIECDEEIHHDRT